MKAKIKSTHEPLIHIAKKPPVQGWKAMLIRAGAIVAALLLCGILTFLLTKLNPIDVYVSLIDGAVGTPRRFWITLHNLAILLCISLAVTPAFKMKFWNIGAEGQALMGGLATAACAMFLGESLPPHLLIPVMLIASIVAGAIWGLIPSIFKALWGTNETLFTLMMNYIAIQLVSYFCFVFSVPKGSGRIQPINEKFWLPTIADNDYLFNILCVLVLTVIMYIYLKYSKQGYEISVVGESVNTATYIGINVKKVIIRTMIISGAICGIAGFLLVAGASHTVADNTIGGRGFTAIMVSWLAKFNPFSMILTSFLIAFLDRGAVEIATQLKLNQSFPEIITGIIIFFIIGSEFFINYSVKFRKSAKKEANSK